MKYLILLLFIVTASLNAQVCPHKQLTVNSGLPCSEIYHVIQDSKGFIWIASDKGVSMYNGYEFTNYDLNDGLPRIVVFELLEDKNGRIWCVTVSGELAIIEDGKIRPYKFNDVIVNNKKRGSYPIKSSFYADTLDNVYICFENSPVFYISPLGELTKLDNDGAHNKMQYVYDINDNIIFTSNHTYKTNDVKINVVYDNNNIVSTKTDVDIKRRSSNRSIATKYNDHIIYTLNKQVISIDSNGDIKAYPYDQVILWVSVDNDNNLWIGSVNGGARAYNDLNFDKPLYTLAPDMSVSSVTRDNEGGYWVSTISNGILYYPSLDMEIFNEKTGLATSIITEIENNRGNIWFGGRSKYLYRYNSGEVDKYDINYPNIYECRLISGIGDSIFVSYYGSENNVSLVINEGKVVSYTGRSYFHSAFKGHDNKVYGTLDCIYQIIDKNLANKTCSNDFTKIYDTEHYKNNIVLLGTNVGLYSFNTETKLIDNFLSSDLLKVRVNCIYNDRYDNIWIGTKGNGLILLRSNRVRLFKFDDNFTGSSVTSIKRKGDILWIATNNGIAKAEIVLNGDFLSLDNIIKIPGMHSDEVYDLTIDSTHVFAATQKGLVRFNQNYSTISPQTYFTGVKINSKDTVVKSNYLLASDENSIEISFIGLSYAKAGNILYKYKLDGIDSEWRTTIHRSVQYPMLNPGNYTFKLKAVNYQGVETEKPLQLNFIIKKPYYDTIWFRTLIAAVICSIILLIFSIKLRVEKKRVSLTHSMNLYRQQALSAQMNPHFIYNSLNSIQNYILQNNRETSSKYLSLFSRLMRQILENSQNRLISLKEEIDALKLYVDLELIRFRDNFDFRLEIDNELQLRDIFVPPLILQPYVENAIHHGLIHKTGSKELVVRIVSENDFVTIEIRDNGIGRKNAEEIKRRKTNTYKSMGMDITTKRVELFKTIYSNKISVEINDLTSDRNLPIGTSVKITLTNNDNDF
jgi:hypothetical protein